MFWHVGSRKRGKRTLESGMSESKGSNRKFCGVRNPRQERRINSSSREMMLCNESRSKDRNKEVQKYVEYEDTLMKRA